MSCFRRGCMIRRQCTSKDPMRCHYEEACEGKVGEDLTIIQSVNSVKVIPNSLITYKTPTKTE